MLENAQVTPILPVADLPRATAFYRDKLGLKDLGDDPTGQRLLQTGAGSTIGLMPAEEGAQTAHTVLTFEIESAHNEVRELERRGVSFLDYDTPELRTVDHIATMGGEKAAWFADSEGNIICVHERAGGDRR